MHEGKANLEEAKRARKGTDPNEDHESPARAQLREPSRAVPVQVLSTERVAGQRVRIESDAWLSGWLVQPESNDSSTPVVVNMTIIGLMEFIGIRCLVGFAL